MRQKWHAEREENRAKISGKLRHFICQTTFDLVQDFVAVLEAMPADHPWRRILKLLDEANRRDVHFIDRHPTTLFQCLWNTCWWYDCPDAAQHYNLPKGGRIGNSVRPGPVGQRELEDAMSP